MPDLVTTTKSFISHLAQSRRPILLLLLAGLLLAGCNTPPTPTPPTASPTAAAVAQSTSTATPLPPTASATLPPPATPTPIPTTRPGPTDTPTATPQPTATATSLPPIFINGLPPESFILMPPETVANVQAIFARGQALGRDPYTFSKLGDSVALTSHYLTKFDEDRYNLGSDYAYLQPAIDHYAGSFARYGVAIRVGLHAWSVFDPLWANKEWCEPNEDMLTCEFRLNNPSVLLIRLGSNDNGPGFGVNLRKVVEFSIENGVIPILGTKADRFEGEGNENNLAIRAIAEEYQVPLFDFDLVAGTLPGRGLGSDDDVHLTITDANDYTLPQNFQRGYPVHDLVILMTLYQLLNQVVWPGE